MEKIISAVTNVMKILGKPRQVEEEELRFIKYCVQTPVDGGVLLFHVLTRELLFLTQEEYENRTKLPKLREGFFLVPEDFQDRQVADNVRLIQSIQKKKSQYIRKYTIFTTTDCNARCFYCYELGRSRVPMSAATAEKVAAYILKHCGGESVRLQWFGGEPLYNKEVIDIICKRLKEQGISYQSKMISNGYLFTPKSIETAAFLWKLKLVQITLDGTEKTYNQCKAYIYKEGNPYEIVLHNIEGLLSAGIFVQIRLNMGTHNVEELFALVRELSGRFPQNDKLKVYCQVLYDFSGKQPTPHSVQERKELYAKKRELEALILECGFRTTTRLQTKLPVNYCMADHGSAVTILPQGEIGLCEHYTETEFIGHIDQEKFCEEVVQSFREYQDSIPECEACFYYPECFRLKKCEEASQCTEEIRQQYEDQMTASMKYEYELYQETMQQIDHRKEQARQEKQAAEQMAWDRDDEEKW